LDRILLIKPILDLFICTITKYTIQRLEGQGVQGDVRGHQGHKVVRVQEEGLVLVAVLDPLDLLAVLVLLAVLDP